MADTHGDGLGYGHFGDITYYAEGHKWNYQRPLRPSFRIEAVGPAQLLVPAPQDGRATTKDAGGTANPARGDRRTSPELVPATHLISSLDQTARAVMKAKDLQDPMLGRLLAFGRIYDPQRERVKPVSAFVSDFARKRLCLTMVQSQRQGWSGDLATCIRVPQLGGDTGSWLSPSPILQVELIGEASERLGLLAVRTFHGTYLLQIRLEASVALQDDGTATRFMITVKNFVPVKSDRASMHAHVCQNIWSPGQFATIDVAGRWQVFNTNLKPTARSAGVQHALAGGVISPAVEANATDFGDFLFDGWARLLWISNGQTILVCNRMTLSLVDLQTASSTPIILDKPQKQLWILDLQIEPTHPDRVLVLTAAYLYFGRVHKPAKIGKASGMKLELLAKVRHYRDHSDPTLQMSLSMFNTSTVAFLSSSASSMTSTIVFDEKKVSGRYAIFSAPQTLPVLLSNSKSPPTEVLIQPAHWTSSESGHLSGSITQLYRQRNIQFLVVMTVHRDLSVFQRLLAIVPGHDAWQDLILPPRWRSKVKLTPGTTTSGFVVEDDELYDDEDEELSKGTEKVKLKAKNRMPYKRSLDLQEFYELLIERGAQALQDMTAVVSRLQSEVSVADDSRISTRLLSELVSSSPAVSDLDESDEVFNNLLQRFGPESYQPTSRPAIHPIAPPDLLHIHLPNPSLTLRNIYASIITTHLSPLSPSIPARIRLAREHLARRTAAQLLLSSHALRPPPTNNGADLPAALARLSQLSTSTLASVNLPTLTQRVILSHWPPGADPAGYDFITARRAAIALREDEDLTDADRARRERRAVRFAARREREARRAMESSQAVAPEVGSSQVQSSQVFGSSQGFGASQQAFMSSQAMPASQGFGSQVPRSSQGRMPVRKKPKIRRVEGF